MVFTLFHLVMKFMFWEIQTHVSLLFYSPSVINLRIQSQTYTQIIKKPIFIIDK